jgi:hypothetical protein
MILDELDELPAIEAIHTHTDERRERRKTTAARQRKGKCSKRPFSRKQALSSIGNHRAYKHVAYLRAYKCPKCGYWHLTHKPQRVKV